MKILLVMPNYGQKEYYFIPFGIMYVSSYLKQQGYDVHCLNQNHHPSSKLRDILQENSFDVVGTGGSFLHISLFRSVIRAVREHNPQAKIILGGAIASADPEFIFDELKPDFLVIGEGERTTDFLLQALKNNSDLHQVMGIAFKENGVLVKTRSTPPIQELDQLPYPDYEGFEFGYYLDHYTRNNQDLYAVKRNEYKSRIGFAILTRDCVSKCTFCFRVMGGNFRTRSINNLMGEIRYLIDTYKINQLILMDNMFAIQREMIFELCKALKPLGLPWRCQARTASVDDELLALLKDAGCYRVLFGFESGSPKVLKSMRKETTPRLIERAIRGCVKAKITFTGNFIFGDPAETLETIQETINFTRKFERISIGYEFIFPYPGTALYHKLIAEGKLPDRLVFYENPESKIYNMTSLSDVDFKYLRRKVIAERHRQESLCCGKILRLRKIKEGIYTFDIRCHHCRQTNENCCLDLRTWNFIVCKHCYQKTFVDMADFRFCNLSAILDKLYYLYGMRLLILTPSVHRLLSPLTSIARTIRKSLRGVWAYS